MSDLFKDQKPELTEEEDRLLWQRVRTIPLPPPDPWWKRLFSMPAVRYGAPAFAVLLAAVVYVVERAPEPTLRPSKAESSREETTAPEEPSVVHRVLPPPVVTEEEPLSRPASPTDGAPPAGNPAEALKRSADQPVPTAAADKDRRLDETSARKETFAQPPAALMKAKPAEPTPSPAAESAPAPAEGTRERKQAVVAPQSAAGAAAPSTPTWGEQKSNYRDNGQATGLSGLLAGDALPSRAALASHPIVAEVAGPGALSGSVPLPDEPGTRAVIALAPGTAPVAKIEGATLGLMRDMKSDGEYAKFEDAPARLQAAALAASFEHALANPSGTPKAKVEKLLVRARAVAARPDATPGAARLVKMIEGALQAWP